MPSSAVSHRQSWPKNLASLPLFKQVIGFLWLSLYIVTFLSLLSYDPADLGFNQYPPNPNPSNFIGDVGAGLAGMLYFGFGFGAYLFPLLALCCCVASFLGIEIKWTWKPVWLLLFLASTCALLDLQHLGGWQLIRHQANIDSPGGLLGGYIIYLAVPYALGNVGAGVLFATVFGISSIYLFNVNPVMTTLNAFSWYREWKIRTEEERLAKAPPKEQLEAQHKRIRKQIEEMQKKAAMEPDAPVIDAPPPRFNIRRPEEDDEPAEPPEPLVKVPMNPPKPAPPAAKKSDTALVPAPVVAHPDYVLPSLQLLSAPAGKARDAGLSEDQLNSNLALIIETLKRFGVKAEGREITPGATITRYEVFPGEGVRVDKIASLKRDLSRVLRAERINILAPIPGKDTVGIEIANSDKVAVFLRELLESKDWRNTNAKIPIALGKDVYGKTLVADLAAMPHLLIGGTTGSGKSVCINCVLMSFLYRFTPDELRLILIDPKQVEMQVYNAIPHLVVPVVTDPKKVMLALRWVINEMEKRYRILAKVGVRNIAGFNSRVRNGPATPAAESPQLEFLEVHVDEEEGDEADETRDPPIRVPREDDLIIPDKLPYIVVIVDELADLMQTAPADVESAIARLTAKARAAGIHLIVATQTPRREVVTGVIKTNIPARIAFQVPSGLDSRVILDENGAENLLGKGDLLYRPPGQAGYTRGQGAFVSDQEVQSVVDFVGAQGEAQFAPELNAKLSGKAHADMDISEDDKKLIYECFDVIRQEKKASTSNLQRRLRLGYNRAAYVIDYLEKVGVLGPADGAKPREILVDLESYMLDL